MLKMRIVQGDTCDLELFNVLLLCLLYISVGQGVPGAGLRVCLIIFSALAYAPRTPSRGLPWQPVVDGEVQSRSLAPAESIPHRTEALPIRIHIGKEILPLMLINLLENFILFILSFIRKCFF